MFEIRYIPISATVIRGAFTLNRMINFSLMFAGTICIKPDALISLKNVSFSKSSSFNRKHTNPN